MLRLAIRTYRQDGTVPHQFSPIAADRLVDYLADRVVAVPGRAVVSVDGADAADPMVVADAVAEATRARGRECVVVSLHDYVRPASQRLEFGRTDEMSYRTLWFDYEALAREVVDSFRRDGSWLPALWNERLDRSARSAVRTAGPNSTVIVAGPMLLGRAVAFDIAVRLQLSSGALQRNTPHDRLWTVPALLQHERETDGEDAIVVRWDHRDRPAIAADFR